VTFDVRSLLRSDLAGLVQYDNAQAQENNLIRLDANESPYDLPLSLREEICKRLSSYAFNRYPDDLASELREAVAQYTGVPVDGIIAGNGSDELILNLALAVGGGGRVVISTPTFSMYRINSLIAGAVPVEAPRRSSGFDLDSDSLCRVVAAEKAKLVFLCSPNNPTGNSIPVDQMAAILEASQALVVVDEAYIDFGGSTSLPLLRKYPNLVILRTFSKAFGLAGLRVGYLLGNPEVVRELLRVKQPFNLNTYCQVAACIALAYREEFENIVETIRRRREKLFRELASLPGITVFPSEANFLLFRTELPAGDVFKLLLQNGILIRNLHSPGLENCLRVTVGREEENVEFIQQMKKLQPELIRFAAKAKNTLRKFCG